MEALELIEFREEMTVHDLLQSLAVLEQESKKTDTEYYYQVIAAKLFIYEVTEALFETYKEIENGEHYTR